MCDRIDPSIWSPPRGPWPEVTDLDALYDHGQPWCVNAAAHPESHGGYPDPERHLPWHECRSRDAVLDGARRDLDGEFVGVSVYSATAFRFGQPRDDTTHAAPRVVVETWLIDADEPAQRISLHPGEALRLARALVRLADDLTFGHRAA